jgi:hypothetical protein
VASLGGDTRYEVEVSVRNRSAETLSAVVARGTAIDPDGSAIVSFDLGAAPPIAPGQTWTTSAFVVLPAPVVGTTTWRVDVVGAGPPLSASTSTRHRPTLLIVLLCAAVLSLAALVGRRLVHRHAARSELAESQADDAAPSDHAAPSGEAAFRPAEFREHSPV